VIRGFQLRPTGLHGEIVADDAALHSPWGVWSALALMATSAVVPLLYFRGRDWL